jgi:hypothetical protein
LILAVILTLTWQSLRSDRDVLGGALLGFSIALKLTAWPIAIFLLLKGRWRAVGAAAVVFLVLHGLAAMVMGPEAVIDYYRRVGPMVADIYRQHKENYSLWTLGSRLFADDREKILSNFLSTPLVESPVVESFVTIAIPLAVGIAGMVLAYRCRSIDSAFGIMICVSLPLNPISWDHYLILAAVPVAILVRRLIDRGFPRGLMIAFAVAGLLAVFPYKQWLLLAIALFGEAVPGNVPRLPALAGLATYVPLLPLAVWVMLLWRTDRIETAVCDHAAATF